MSIRKSAADSQGAEVSGTDGTASLKLREVGDAGVVSRRGVLWRAGLATAGGVAALSILDEQSAGAATGGNFILGVSNNAGATTVLSPTSATNSNPLMQVNGAALSATSTTMVVNGPSGGAGLAVTGASTSTTTGVAFVSTGSGTATGIVGSSGSGIGVLGSSGGIAVKGSSGAGPAVVGIASAGDGVQGLTTGNGKHGVVGSDTSVGGGVGVTGASTKGTGIHAISSLGTALSVDGKTHFSRAGAGTIATGHSTLTVNVSGLTTSSIVLVTLQKAETGVYVLGVNISTGHFTVHLNKNATSSLRVGWFVVAG